MGVTVQPATRLGSGLASRKPKSPRLSCELHDAAPDAVPDARLDLLGGFEIRVDGEALRFPHHVQRLLAFLALQNRPLHRAYVAERLWMDLSQDHAHGCLRTTLWRMGRLSRPVVECTTTQVGLSAGVTVDARELETCAEKLLHGTQGAAPADIDCLVRASDLLPDWYEDWVLQERERLRQLRLLALEVAAEMLVGARRHAEAAVAALAAVEADPLRESAYRILISTYLAEGNVAEALHQYALFRAQLHRDLGLEPSELMLDLLRRAGEPADHVSRNCGHG
jgi:DNA-binding SARP family transcriptional activator